MQTVWFAWIRQILVNHNLPTKQTWEEFKPSEDAASHVDYFVDLNGFGLRFFVDDVKIGIGLGVFDPFYLALGPNLKAQYFVSLKDIRPNSASFRALKWPFCVCG